MHTIAIQQLYILTLTCFRALPMKISWGRFYDPADYNIEYIGTVANVEDTEKYEKLLN